MGVISIALHLFFPQKAIEKKATALSDSSVVGLAEEKVFGKVRLAHCEPNVGLGSSQFVDVYLPLSWQ